MSNLTTETKNRTRRINLYDVIGAPGITPTAVANAIGDISEIDQLEVHINSPGGVAFDGLAIYNLLTQFPGVVNTVVDGVAASAASVIFMAGQQRTISEGGVIMIHGASVMTAGDVTEHRKQAEVLDRLNNSIAKVYAKATGGDKAAILDLMAEETWMEAEEALADGYATSVSPSQAVACAVAAYMNQYNHVPPQVAAWLGKDTSKESKAMDPEKPETPETPEEETMESLKARIAELEAQIKAMTPEEEEEEEKPEEAQAIAKAFAHDKAFAVDMIASGKSLADAYRAYVDHAQITITALAAKAEAAMDGVNPIAIKAPADAAEPDMKDSAAVAAWEWDNKKTVFNASTRERYVASRVAELDGRLKVKGR